MYQDNLPKKGEIFAHWKDRLSNLGIYIDAEKPSCWACGFHYKDKYDIRKENPDQETISRCWNRIPLQRCHIVPKSLGGTDTPENLFLMCRECHDTAPNTPFREIFFEWVCAQSHFDRESKKILTAMTWFGLAKKDLALVQKTMQSDEFKEWASGKLGIHRPQSNYAATSSRLTLATMIGLVVHYIRTIKNY